MTENESGIINRNNSQLDKNGNWGFKRVDREAGQGRFPATILAGSPIDFCEEQLLQAHELMKGL
jgi:hypothetical protein